jgi:serine/threonine protein kinase
MYILNQAPELILDKYEIKFFDKNKSFYSMVVDIWSVGVLMYEFAYGMFYCFQFILILFLDIHSPVYRIKMN